MASALYIYLFLATVALQPALPAAFTLSGCQSNPGEYDVLYPDALGGFTSLDIAGMSKAQCEYYSGNMYATRAALLAVFRMTPAGHLMSDAAARLRPAVSVIECIECRESEQAANTYEGNVVFFVRAGARGRNTTIVVPAKQLVDEMQHLEAGAVADRLSAPGAVFQFSPYTIAEEAVVEAVPPPCPQHRQRNSSAGPVEDEDTAEEVGGSGCGEEQVRSTRKRNTHVPARRCHESLFAVLQRWYRCYGLHGTSSDCRVPSHEELCDETAEQAGEPAAKPAVIESKTPARGSRGLSDQDVLFPGYAGADAQASVSKAASEGVSATVTIAVATVLVLVSLVLGLVLLRSRRRPKIAGDDDIVLV